MILLFLTGETKVPLYLIYAPAQMVYELSVHNETAEILEGRSVGSL
jgi:hypothetical protein